jgi:Putative porin
LSGNFSLLSGIRIIIILLTGCLLGAGFRANAQNQFQGRGQGGMGKGKGKDSTLQHRVEDSIRINFRYLDSSRLRKLDSTIYDFNKKYPVPATNIDLGNFGTATRSLFFTPNMRPGWDPGWHAYDQYLFTTQETRFYVTTKPYSELGYMLGTKAEQMISLILTENIGKKINLAFEYRLINAPGIFQNQTTDHNNYRFNGWYQSQNKRYSAYFIIVGSNLKSSENGGLQNPSDLDSLAYTQRNTIPTQLGGNSIYNTNPFSVNITTGTLYTQSTVLGRQQYDIIGKKDSIVTDTSVTQLFYPKFRAEQTIQYSTYKYRFIDQRPDTNFYVDHYDFISTPDTVGIGDTWKELINDFSLYQFPDNKNPQQFFKAGLALQDLNGYFNAGNKTIYNVFGHGEYRNKTRNQKWDVEAYGNFYFAGYDAADYNASISLRRLIARNLGYLQLGFQNVSRTPSFSFNQESSFGFGVPGTPFKKENNTNLFGSIEEPQLQLKLSLNYYLMNNYTYFEDYYHATQQTNPFNILQVQLDKVFLLTRHWVLRMLIELQQKAGNSPLNLPFFTTYDQIAYEGKLGFKNLIITFGAEVRYISPYTADNYSPVIGQFFPQNNTTIAQKLPDITAFVNLRIKGFTAYLRAENLNTMTFNGPGGFGFTNNNFVAPNYPSPGLRIRFGVFWSFIN